MAQNICNICSKNFNSEQELLEHQKTAHATGKKEGEHSGGEEHRREDKIAS